MNTNLRNIILYGTEDNALVHNELAGYYNLIRVKRISSLAFIPGRIKNPVIIAPVFHNEKYIASKILKIAGEIPVIFYTDKISIKIAGSIYKSGGYDIIDIRHKFKDKLHKSILESVNHKFAAASKIENYFANIIHELRSPLNILIGYTTILLEKSENEEFSAKLNTIKESSVYMLNIINNSLDWTKLQSQKLELNNLNFILSNMLDHIYNLFKLKADEKNIKYLYHQNNIPTVICGDEMRLTQIIINFLSNAFKFTPEKGTVELSASYENENLVLQIKDSGIGIDKVGLKKLFTPYDQLSKDTSSKYGGTGLGMAITKNLVTLMGGTIDVSSTKSIGTTFKVSIPVATIEQNNIDITKDEEMVKRWIARLGKTEQLKKLSLSAISAIPDRIASLKQSITIGNIQDIKFISHKLKGFSGSYGFNELYEIMKKMDENIKKDPFPTKKEIEEFIAQLENIIAAIPDKYLIRQEDGERNTKPESGSENVAAVLYADDAEENINLMSHYMSKMKITCIPAKNGAEAVELSKKQNYKFIILDIQMPVLDGFGAIKKIREMYQDSIIVASTADISSLTVERIKQSGFNGFISKPFIYETLKREINYFLNLERS